jgi:hypothetical protein
VKSSAFDQAPNGAIFRELRLLLALHFLRIFAMFRGHVINVPMNLLV